MESINAPIHDRMLLGKVRIMKYDKSFKLEAIRLSDEIGVKKAADQLGISYHTLYGWRKSRNRYHDQVFVGSGNKHKPADEKDRKILELERELRESQRANEILKEALGFFAASRKK